MYDTKPDALSERTLLVKRVFSGRLIAVDHLDVTLPDGREAVREVVRFSGAVAVVPIDVDGRVTLVEQYRAPLGGMLLEIPAGKRDASDASSTDAARRELLEETGITAERIVSMTRMAPSPGVCDEVIEIFLATGLHRAPPRPDEDEFLRPVTLPLDEAIERVARGHLSDGKTLCGLLMARDYMRGAGE